MWLYQTWKKPFTLYVAEKQGQALGVLTQKLGNEKRPADYFSKSLDSVAQGWRACLRAVAATALLKEEASKVTMGRSVTVMTSRLVQCVLETQGHQWMTHVLNDPLLCSKTLKKAVLLDTPEVVLKTCPAFNPASLMLGPDHSTSTEHNCPDAFDLVYSSRSDLKRFSC